ncbi:MAG UNVERIFIED_CONTAM: hypothetical protein LVR29_18525, partial [Microcystis novacekii LVE1205-3]
FYGMYFVKLRIAGWALDCIRVEFLSLRSLARNMDQHFILINRKSPNVAPSWLETPHMKIWYH